MKTLKSYWGQFYTDHASVLEEQYPGLSLHRFLMEVGDILKDRTANSRFHLDLTVFQVSPKTLSDMELEFLKGIPFAYLTGFSEFYGHRFYIDPHVLIPRPETELLVDLIVKSNKKFELAADVGVGSGVILLSLLKSGVLEHGEGFDLSNEALKVSRINAQRLRVSGKCGFTQSDRLSNCNKSYDLIVSNPPYIKSSAHRKLVHQNVDTFEPAMALYISDDEYETWFDTFFRQIKKHLKIGGLFYMEGHELELQNQASMLQKLGFADVKVLKDYAGADRFLYAAQA